MKPEGSVKPVKRSILHRGIPKGLARGRANCNEEATARPEVEQGAREFELGQLSRHQLEVGPGTCGLRGCGFGCQCGHLRLGAQGACAAEEEGRGGRCIRVRKVPYRWQREWSGPGRMLGHSGSAQ